MKTAEEFIKEIESSDVLKNEFKAIKGNEALEAFLKKNGCGFTAEEFVKSLKTEGEIEDSDARAVAGGLPPPFLPE